MTIDNLERELKQDKLGSLYLLYGEETFLLDTAVKKIKKLFGEILPGINQVQIEEQSFFAVVNEIETPAFGFDRKLIILKNSGIFKKKKGQTTNNPIQAELTDYIEKNIEFINENVVLLIIESSGEGAPAKNNKFQDCG